MHERVRSASAIPFRLADDGPKVVKTSMIELLAPFVKQSEALAATKQGRYETRSGTPDSCEKPTYIYILSTKVPE